MTTWDKIYKNFQEGGEAWATLSEDIDPLFKEFLRESDFAKRSVLDIGCGTGKYLKLLQSLGFETDGIDSSETAVEMTKELLGDDSAILQADMFDYEIIADKYDLVISISTIHHGTKDQVQNLVNMIYQALIPGGKIFITFPDIAGAKKWNTFQEHKEVGPGTYAPMSGPEKGLPHSFYAKEEVRELFSGFKDVKMDLDEIGRWFVRATK